MEYHIKTSEDIKKLMYDHYLIFNGREVVKELGESLFVEIGDTWIFDEKQRGFICWNPYSKKVKYLYVFFPFRKFGVGSMLLSMLPSGEFSTTATKKSKSLFEKAGFKATKEFINYFKMKRE
jgi:hypothetical protein